MFSLLFKWLKSWQKRIKVCYYSFMGSRPWSRGYAEHKEAEIVKCLADGRFPAESLPFGFGFRLDERIVEYPWLVSRLPKASGILLDAGSTLNQTYLLSQPSLRAKKFTYALWRLKTSATGSREFPIFSAIFVAFPIEMSCLIG